jgi:hypothetical protein
MATARETIPPTTTPQVGRSGWAREEGALLIMVRLDALHDALTSE